MTNCLAVQVTNSSVSSEEGELAVAVNGDGASQHASQYPGGMEIVRVLNAVEPR